MANSPSALLSLQALDDRSEAEIQLSERKQDVIFLKFFLREVMFQEQLGLVNV